MARNNKPRLPNANIHKDVSPRSEMANGGSMKVVYSRSEINDTLAPVSISRTTTFPAILTVHTYGLTVGVPVVWCKLSVYVSSHKSFESFFNEMRFL